MEQKGSLSLDMLIKSGKKSTIVIVITHMHIGSMSSIVVPQLNLSQTTMIICDLLFY